MKITNKQLAYSTQAPLRGRGWGRLLLFFSFLWLLPSCSKENTYKDKMYAEGRVVEKGKIQAPVAGAKVILYNTVSTQLGGTVSFVALDTVISDADGYYRMETTGAPNTVYHIAAFGDPEQFWNRSDEPYEGNGLNYGSKNVNTLFIQPYSFVQVHVKNTKPVDEEDAIGIGGTWGNSIADEVFYHGTQINESFIRRIIGNDTTKVGYEVTKLNIGTVYKSEKHFAKSHDTIKIKIDY
jgi:hypothetical protein